MCHVCIVIFINLIDHHFLVEVNFDVSFVNLFDDYFSSNDNKSEYSRKIDDANPVDFFLVLCFIPYRT